MSDNNLVGKGATETNIRTISFKNQWLNFCLYMPQFMYKTKRKPSKNDVCPFIIADKQNRLKGNNQPIGGGQIDTIFLANGNNYMTSFIDVDKRDLVNMYERLGNKHGFTSRDLPTLHGLGYKSEYNPINNRDQNGIFHFFRGLRNADCLRFLRDKNII